MRNQSPEDPSGLALHLQDTQADQEAAEPRGQCQGPVGRSARARAPPARVSPAPREEPRACSVYGEGGDTRTKGKPPHTRWQGGESLRGHGWRIRSQRQGQRERSRSSRGDPASQETKRTPGGSPGQKALAGGAARNGTALVPTREEPLGVGAAAPGPRPPGYRPRRVCLLAPFSGSTSPPHSGPLLLSGSPAFRLPPSKFISTHSFDPER